MCIIKPGSMVKRRAKKKKSNAYWIQNSQLIWNSYDFDLKQNKKKQKKFIVHDFVLIGQTALHLIGIIFSWRHYLRPFKCIWNSYNELDDWTAPLDFPNNCMVIASSTGFIFRKWLSFRTLLVTVHHLLLGQTVSFLFVNVMNCERIVCKRQLKPSIDI